MRYFILILFVLATIIACESTPPESPAETAETTPKMPQEIQFTTADSVQIVGDLYEQDKGAATILLFHQGGSNARAEYGLISPRLFANGYNILAIDQR